MAKYKDKWKTTFPASIGNQTRPEDGVDNTQEYNTDGLPQYMANDPVRYDLQNAIISQLVSNDERLNEKIKRTSDDLAAHNKDPKAHATGISGNAATATKLQTPRTLSLTGKAAGSATFDGAANASINVTSVNADTASKLATARKINITGDATGAANFDGSGNVSINTTVSNAANAERIRGESFWSNNNNYLLIGTLTIGQNGDAFGIKIQSGNFFNDGIERYSREASLYFRASNASTAKYSAYAEYHRYGSSGMKFFINETSDNTYDIYLGPLMWSGNSICIPILSTACSFDKKYTNVSALPTGAKQVNSYQLVYTDTVNNYAPTKTGSGASGTWDISITGNADTASKLATARNIALTGNATGSAGFDGTSDVSINVNVNESKHAEKAKLLDGFDGFDNGSWGTTIGEVINGFRESGGGSIQWRADSGKIYQKVDGTYWQREGAYEVIDTSTVNNYAPTKTGTGASGTWGISITGNAASATNADTVDGYHAQDILDNITAANVGGIIASALDTNGYVKFASGLLIVWGNGSAGNNDDTNGWLSATLPIKMSKIFVAVGNVSSGWGAPTWLGLSNDGTNISGAWDSCSSRCNSVRSFRYIAIGNA